MCVCVCVCVCVCARALTETLDGCKRVFTLMMCALNRRRERDMHWRRLERRRRRRRRRCRDRQRDRER